MTRPETPPNDLRGRTILLAARGRSSQVALLILAIVAVYWLWFGLTQRSIFQDEGISLLAAQGIAETGFPRLPSGFLYGRGYLPHYLVGGAIYAFGVNSLAIMLPSLLMGLGSLWVVYLYGRNIIGKPWVGIAAIAVLLALQMQTLYATSPRMYMTLQFFTMLATYSAWRGHIQGDGKFKWVTFIAILAAILSHQQGIALVVAIPLSVLALTWITGHKMTRLYAIGPVGGLLALVAISAFVTLYKVPGGTPLITAYSFQGTGFLGLRLNPLDWARDSLTLKQALIFGFGFMPLLLFLTVASIRRRWRDIQPGSIYALSLITVSAVITAVGTGEAYPRMWFFTLPLFALAGCAGMVGLAESFGPKTRGWLRNNSASRAGALSLLVIVAVAALSLGSLTLGLRPGLSYISAHIAGLPCQGNNCDKSIRDHYIELQQQIGPGDLIVSSNPFVTDYYLGRVDRYLRDKAIIGKDGTVSTFEFLTDEYFGIPLVDADDLDELLSDERRVWVITDQRTAWISSAETLDVLENAFASYHTGELVTTYTNCPQQPCGQGR